MNAQGAPFARLWGRLSARLRQDFLWRWVAANIVGWTLGLYLTAPYLQAGSLFPLLVCGGGVIASGGAGLAQWWSLRPDYPQPRRWVWLSLAAGLIGTVPAAVGSLFLVFGRAVGVSLAGAIFGATLGLMQWLVLKQQLERAGWWIAANALAGALCGLLTLTPILPPLPVGLLLGSALFGYITGRALLWIAGALET
jgi:hypothetical protein